MFIMKSDDINAGDRGADKYRSDFFSGNNRVLFQLQSQPSRV